MQVARLCFAESRTGGYFEAGFQNPGETEGSHSAITRGEMMKNSCLTETRWPFAMMRLCDAK